MSDGDVITDCDWWSKEGDESANVAHGLLKRIRNRQEYRRQQFLIFASMYGGTQLASFGQLSYSNQAQWLGTQLSLNVAKSVTDAVLASVAAKSKPKPAFTTVDDWQLRRRAMKQGQLVDGAMTNGKYYRLMPMQFRDGEIYGTGLVKVMETRKKTVGYERCLPFEVTVDDSESRQGDPQGLFQSKWYDRGQLIKCAKAWGAPADTVKYLEEAKRGELEPYEYGLDPTSNQVYVHEGWRLPSGVVEYEEDDERKAKEDAKDPEETDGRHIIFVEGKMLVEEPYDWEVFPFSKFLWNPPDMGWYGEGLIQEIAGIQLEINDMLDELVEAVHGIKGFWWVDEASEVNFDHINDELVKIIEGKGQPPSYIQPTAIPPDFYEHLWRLVNQAYEIPGKSQLAATSKKPAGLNSGEALRAYAAQDSDRFLHKYNMLEDTVCDTADLTDRVLRGIAKKNKGKSVALYVRTGEYMRKFDLSKMDIERDKYAIEIQPSSQLPNTLAGRIDFAQEMAKTGAFSPDELMDVMQSPDTKDLVHRRNATKRYVEAAFDAIWEREEFQPPEGEMDLKVALPIALNLYVEARELKAPEEVIDEMVRWLAICKAQIEKSQTPQKPPVDHNMPPPPQPDALMQPPPGALPPSPIPAPPGAMPS